MGGLPCWPYWGRKRQEGGKVLTGWERIEKEVGMCSKTIKRLVREEGFPIIYTAGRPMTSAKLIDDWIMSRMDSARQAKDTPDTPRTG